MRKPTDRENKFAVRPNSCPGEDQKHLKFSTNHYDNDKNRLLPRELQ